MTNTYDEYITKAAGRQAPGRPPRDWHTSLAQLIHRRPELVGVGWGYLTEAITANV